MVYSFNIWGFFLDYSKYRIFQVKWNNQYYETLLQRVDAWKPFERSHFRWSSWHVSHVLWVKVSIEWRLSSCTFSMSAFKSLEFWQVAVNIFVHHQNNWTLLLKARWIYDILGSCDPVHFIRLHRPSMTWWLKFISKSQDLFKVELRICDLSWFDMI